MPKKKSCRVTIVPETHWDRAWYIPFEQFRIRLVRFIDRLLETLQKDKSFKAFSLDGQTVVIEDYLQIRPEKRADIEKMVKNKSLFVGPWYILPDEFLVSGESLVRNLLAGQKIAAELGHRMSVGYVPDPFGHVGQLPQILQGFDLDSFIFSRGLLDPKKVDMEFNWKAPDGTKVLAIHQRFWYNNAAFLGYPIEWGDSENLRFNMSAAIQQLKQCVENLERESKGRSYLLNNGIDHSEHQPQLPRIVAKARKLFPDWDIQIGSFEEYVDNIKKDLKGTRLRSHEGELTYRYGDLLTGVYSARMYLKQFNHRCETLLERYAEPLEALANAAGKRDDTQAIIDYAWRELLKNHPHDDICGCSVDSVHRDMMNRFERIEQICEYLNRENLRRIAHQMNHTKQNGVPFVLFNGSGVQRRGAQRMTIQFLPGEKELIDGFQLVDESGKTVPFSVEGRRTESWVECLKDFTMESFDIVADLRNIPGYGFITLYASPLSRKQPKPSDPIQTTKNSIENKAVKVTVADDGSLTVTDRRSRKTYRRLHVFEDQEDLGDEYNWSPLPEPEVVLSKDRKARVSVIQSTPHCATLRIQQKIRIPASIGKDRKSRSPKKIDLPITSEITLRSGSSRIDIETSLENAAEDHRLRVLFPTGIDAEQVSVDEHFDVVQRTTTPPPPRVWNEWEIPPYPTEHQKSFVDVTDGKTGLAILNKGLPEYESIPERNGVTLALTLFRAVGWLSRGDMITRPANAGPPVPAPEAQCKRHMTFRYAIYPHKGDWAKGEVLQESKDMSCPVLVCRADQHGGSRIPEGFDQSCMLPVPPEGSLPDRIEVVRIEPESIVLSAFKNTQNGRGAICRFYNPTEETQNTLIRFGMPVSSVREVSLDERPVRGGKSVAGQQVRMRIKPKKIVTLLVRFK